MLVGKNGPGKIALCLMLSLFLGFGSLIVPGTANAVTGENEVTLALSSSTAEIGDEITASGIADPDTWVSIKVVDETGNIVFYDAVKSEDSGAYSCTFRVPISSGILTVVAGYGTNVATGDLTVTTDVTTDVTLELSSYGAKVGDVITASGTAGPDTWISIKVVDEMGNIVFYDAVKSKAGGDYSCEFRVPQVSPGTLTIVAGYGTNVASKPLVISEGGDVTLESIMITKPATKLVYIKGDSLDISGLEVTGHYSNGTSRVETITTANVSDFDSSKPGRQLLTITINGKTATYEVTITKPIEAKKDQTITIEDDPVTITVPVEASGAKIDVADKKESLPLIAVRAATDVGKVEMAIPEGTKISKAPADWNGKIQLPVKLDKPNVPKDELKDIDESDICVISVGAKDSDGNDIVLEFDQAVRLLIPGQKDRTAAYVRNGKLIEITRSLAQDKQAFANDNNNIPKGEEAALDVGNDKVIWTKHFTEFLTYKSKETTPDKPGTGGGGGGGGAFFGGTAIKADQGGKLSGHGATVEIPGKAFEKDFRVKIEKATNAAGLPMPQGGKLASEVVDITKNEKGDFTKPITITMTFDKSKVDDKAEIGLYWYDSSSKTWNLLDNIEVDMDKATVSGETTHFTKFAVIAVTFVEEVPPTPPVVVLTDITGHWAEASIKALVDKGAIAGYPDHTFQPNRTITRAEFAKVLVKAFELEAKDGKVFEDTASHWAKDDIATANAHGIIKGYSDQKFGPNDLITREQVAVMVTRAANLTASDQAPVFTDSAEISDWAQEAVASAAEAGIINGYPDGSFQPQGNATRAEAATIIMRAIK